MCSSDLERRARLGLTQRELAERAGLSARFWVQLEAGQGNVSIQRLADVATALRTIGRIAGTSDIADASATAFDARVRQLRADHAGAPSISVFIEIDDEPLYTVNGRHVISEIVELCGGRNVFAELPQLAPPVSLEAVLARDPQVILSTDDTITDPLALWRRWTRTAAVRDGTIYSMSSDTLTRATPRLADGAREVCAALDDARGKTAGPAGR